MVQAAATREVRPRALLALVALLSACSGHPTPPATAVREVVDRMHGTAVPDPYRWLEDPGSPETRSWIEAQNAFAERVVGTSPVRARIEERLRELTDTPELSAPRRAGDHEYFTLRRRGEELPVIYRRPAPSEVGGEPVPVDPEDGDYEVVLDPHGRSPGNTTRFDIVALADDGSLMIYSERDGGQDEVTLRVRDLRRGVDLPDSLPLSLYGSILLDDDAGGFHYVKRSREVGPRLLYHRMGTPVARDTVVFGEGYGPETFLGVSRVDDGRYFVYEVRHGWARSEVHFRDLAAGGAVQTLVDDADARFYTRFLDGELYLRTDLGADRNRLLAVDLANPARERWREVVPESGDVLEDFTLIDGKLYLTYLRDVSNVILVFEKDGTPAGEIEVPPLHTASIRGAGEGKALLTLSSFTTRATVYELDLGTGERVLREEPEVDWDSSGVVVEQVWRTSRDGTRAPMFILRRRDTPLDGRQPVLLSGYGGFYAAQKPGFSAAAALWLEMGGVYAVATLRGGSEFGESWHRDGMLENKQNVFDDFISAAEWLIEAGYTSPARLAIEGSSNGGLLVGAALTQRPELFRAVVCGFPDLDILRFPEYTRNNNAPALLEYGDARIPGQFEAIRRYSPYQNVRDGTPYPAVMLVSGDLDTRVPPLAARKMTARLQAATTSGLPVILRYHPKAGHSAGRGLPFSRRLADEAMEMTFLAQQLGMEVVP